MQSRWISIFVMLLLCGLISACGGGGASLGTPDEPGPGDDSRGASLSLSDWAGRQRGAVTSLGETALPAFPVEDGSTARTASGDSDRTVLGNEYLLEEGGSLPGDGSLILDGAAGEHDLSWALYKIDGLAGLRASSLNVECIPQGWGEDYYVGVADFTHLRWQWFGPVSIPEYQLDLAAQDERYVSELGNLYFVLVAHGDNQARHYSSTVVADSEGECLPGAPRGLYASKGEFPDGIAVMWESGAGAEHYELQRRGEVWFGGGEPGSDGGSDDGIDDGIGPDGGPSNHGGDPLDPVDDLAWETIAVTADSMYFDYNMPPDVMFEYRVRAVNSCGASIWSNTDFGFVHGNGGGGDYPLQGYVYEVRQDGPGDDGSVSISPLADAVVEVISVNGEAVAACSSDESGYYFFDQLPGGQYFVNISKPGYQFEPQGLTIDVHPGLPGYWIDFSGYGDGGGGGDPGDAGVHGRAFGIGDMNEAPVPLEGVLITVTDVQSGVVIDSRLTDGDGFYQFLALPPGAYQLNAELDGWFFGGLGYYFEFEGETPDVNFDFYGERMH